MFNIEEEIKRLPKSPGVYIMKDLNGEIIYIGKAKVLKNRVTQYFRSNKNHSPKVIAMVKNIVEFEYIITDSELEALILECNLIKKHQPKYNILLKDDKHYPYIKVTTNEDYPRVLMTRKYVKDGSKYFGPFTDISAVKETLLIIEKHFLLRDCKKSLEYGMAVGRPCLNFHIGRCLAPCTGEVEKEKYSGVISSVLGFLSGKDNELLRILEFKMKKASEELDFEKAKELRDEIFSIKKIREKQKIISSTLDDEDVIAFSKDENSACIEVFFVRGGKLLGRENFYFEDVEEDNALVYSFLTQFYSNRDFVPREILLQSEIEEANIIASFLSRKKGSKVNIKVPKRGDKNNILEMAKKNADIYLENVKHKMSKEYDSTMGAIEELKAVLDIDNLPRRIEAYDISNINGVDPVGSMVVFEDGKPLSKDYRRFKIKTVIGPNDYKSLEEVIERRFKRGLKEREENNSKARFSKFPDLILMDGGIGQVNIALGVLKKLSINIPVCGMVKDYKHRTRALLYNSVEIDILKNSNSFKLITRIQDEVHRVAITYHKSLRSKSLTESELDNIEGIGDKRKKELLSHFKSIDKIKSASLEELETVKGISKSVAEKVVEYFNK